MELKAGYKQYELLTGQKHSPRFNGEWEIKKIGDFTSCTAGGTPSTFMPTYWGGEIKWMNSGELHKKFIDEVEGRITQEGLYSSSTKLVPKKCVLVGLAGQGKTRGTVAINLVELCTNQSIAAIFPSPKHVSEYLFYNLEFRYEELRNLSSGEGGRGGLNLAIIKSILVPLPSIPEQRAVAAVLGDMDALIAALDRLIAKKRDIKRAAMQELLTGKRRLPGFSGGWRRASLKNLLKVRHGRSQLEIIASDGKYPILATSGEIGRTNNFLYDKPSVLIGRKGTIDSPQYIDSPFWTIDTLFYTEIGENCTPKFMFYKFCMIDWRRYNEASGVPSLNAYTIEEIRISYPDLDEQSAIARVLSDMDAEIAALEKRREKTLALKQGMMQELLTGRIRLVQGGAA